jgi:hypothetical protein
MRRDHFHIDRDRKCRHENAWNWKPGAARRERYSVI